MCFRGCALWVCHRCRRHARIGHLVRKEWRLHHSRRDEEGVQATAVPRVDSVGRQRPRSRAWGLSEFHEIAEDLTSRCAHGVIEVALVVDWVIEDLVF